jgi:hypothetical protein
MELSSYERKAVIKTDQSADIRFYANKINKLCYTAVLPFSHSSFLNSSRMWFLLIPPGQLARKSVSQVKGKGGG